MTEDEKYVRERHPMDVVRESWIFASPWAFQNHTHNGLLVRFGASDNEAYQVEAKGNIAASSTNFQAWSAAAEFTRTRLQQIRDVEEEIEWLDREATICDTEQGDWLKSGMDVMASSCSDSAVVIRRILAREQAALADLKRGLRS